MNLLGSSGGSIGWQELDPGVVLCFFRTCFLGSIEGKKDGEEMGVLEELGVRKETGW